jgi:Family of unknown function (DUF6155)
MSQFTIANLKKQLLQKNKEELVKEIATLCQTFPQVKEYYKAQIGDIGELAKKYKGIIEKEFGGGTRGLPKARFSVARKAVNDFKKLTDDPEEIADVMLAYVESISQFNSEYAPDAEKYYTVPEDMFETVLDFIQKHQLTENFRLRSHNIVQQATEGWGHKDSLEDRYYEVYGDFVE